MEVNQGTSGIVITFNEYELNQHDLEIRADERKKVREELEEWVKKYQFFIGDCVCIADTQENIYLGEAIDKLAKYENTSLEPKEVEQLKKENEELKSAQNKVAVEKLEELKDRVESFDYKTTTKKEQYNKLIYTINGLLAELKGE